MKSGIYRIGVVRPDGLTRYYVGQSSNIDNRIRTHWRKLRDGSHWNLGLLLDFKRHGESAFSHSTLIVCAPQREALALYEQIAVNAHDPATLYNIRIQCVITGLGVPASAERKAKIAASLRGIKRSDETKAAVSRAQAWKHTPEGKRKMSLAATGRKATPEQRSKRSLAMKASGPFPAASYARGAQTRALNKAVLERGSAWVLCG